MHPISRTLRTFSCTNLLLPYERSEVFFRKLPNVQTLKCQIEHDDPSKLILKLDYLSRLEALRVRCRTFADNSISAAISRLPNLEVLKLDGGILGKAWDVEDNEFQNLKFLRLSYLGIEEFIASDDSFPVLQHFVVKACWYLQEIPIRFASISTLKIIEVDGHLESSARYIQEEQKDLGNDMEVRIS
ncbi:hypothetical protein M9H77_10576 [Catharanthus roseus]|uniref:Uncharacterized protein n=1 Tax=Catharanthus roseus TaxID=4058 RepID=A0ACC0BC88_CATRO|nr:hypothetical protein M9H77_10576 [Catharanthus roseus]